MIDFFSTPYFGISLTLIAYMIGYFIKVKTKKAISNPILIAIIICIAFVLAFDIDVEKYSTGGQYVSLFLVPATVCLAIPIYKKRDVLKKYFLPVVIGCGVGSVVSMASIYFMCKAFGLDETITASLIPKSITTPFGMKVSENLGGIPSLTVICIILTGVLGAVIAPLLIKIFKVNDKAAQGIAIGTCSHAIGTTKALELGETQGAMSGIAISIAGLITVGISLFLI